MRSHDFLHQLNGYNFDVATQVASQDNFRGGWESWFQVEIAMFFQNMQYRIVREQAYPIGPEICDFYVNKPNDSAYMELKCINTNHAFIYNRIVDIFHRFNTDIDKVIFKEQQAEAQGAPINCFAIAAFYGMINDSVVSNPAPQPAPAPAPDTYDLRGLVRGRRTVYIYNCATRQIFSKDEIVAPHQGVTCPFGLYIATVSP